MFESFSFDLLCFSQGFVIRILVIKFSQYHDPCCKMCPVALRWTTMGEGLLGGGGGFPCFLLLFFFFRFNPRRYELLCRSNVELASFSYNNVTSLGATTCVCPDSYTPQEPRSSVKAVSKPSEHKSLASQQQSGTSVREGWRMYCWRPFLLAVKNFLWEVS